jgi:PAS domain S-box-containing protein
MNSNYWGKLINEMPLGFLVLNIGLDNDGKFADCEFVEANAAFVHAFTLRTILLSGRKLSEIETEAPAFFELLQRLLNDFVYSKKAEIELTGINPDKHYRARFFEIDRNLIGLVLKEITVEKLVDAQKRQIDNSIKNFYTFFNSVYDMLYILDYSGNIIHANKTVFDRLGYSEKELYGHSVLIVHPTHRREEALLNVQEMLAGKREYCPIPVVTKDGTIIPVETRVSKGEWNGKPVLFGVSKDISELKKSEEKFSKAFHNSGALMAISTASD